MQSRKDLPRPICRLSYTRKELDKFSLRESQQVSALVHLNLHSNTRAAPTDFLPSWGALELKEEFGPPFKL